MSEALPTHTTCPYCKHAMRMSLWVYAHWDIPVEVTCSGEVIENGLQKSEGCGKKYYLRRGVVSRRKL
jgi:hypothetical protein